jgi:hypothetical protein
MSEIKPRESQISAIFRQSTFRQSTTVTRRIKNLTKVAEEEEDKEKAEVAVVVQPTKAFSYMDVSFYRAAHIISSIVIMKVVHIQRFVKTNQGLIIH